MSLPGANTFRRAAYIHMYTSTIYIYTHIYIYVCVCVYACMHKDTLKDRYRNHIESYLRFMIL